MTFSNILFYSVYDDVCEMMTEYFKHHTCPNIVTDHGLTCNCPVDGISYFINSLNTQLNSMPSKWYFLIVVSIIKADTYLQTNI